MNVLVLLPIDDAQRERLEAAAPEASFIYADQRAVAPEQVAEAEVIVGNLAPARLVEAPRLRFLQLHSAGYDNYVTAPMAAGARVACASGAYGQTVSEHMLAMVLSQIKRLPSYHDDQHAHTWTDEGSVTTLRGSSVLVLGAGDIGTHFADLADAEFFGAMKPGSYFANGGRGDLVVTEDLIEALESGHLAGASLDVTNPEPLPADHPLWETPGALVTPHVSGWFHPAVTLDNIVGIAAENLRRLQAGEELRNLVRVA